jgi:hypothetical protein
MNGTAVVPLFLLLGLSAAAAQTPGVVVHGRVTDTQGSPVSGVVVRVVGTALVTTTDDSGLYRLTGVPSGTRVITADAKYFEVYNNGDTAIYLDGMYWGIGWHLIRDYPAWPCAQTGRVRNDPDGVWVSRVFRFPGRGTDHALAPGQTALIAKAAVDHRIVDPRLPDLSHADFEWGGSSADNPDVPNLTDIGPQRMVANWPFPESPQFLSEPVDLASLPRYTDPYSGDDWVRIPRALVLDVAVIAQDWTTSNYTPVASCLETTHRYFERLPGPAWAATDPVQELTEQRRVLMVLPDGREVLQDTETSMADFVKAAMTPGWIP